MISKGGLIYNRTDSKINRSLVLLSSMLVFTANIPILKAGPVSLSFFIGLLLLIFVFVKSPQLTRIHKDFYPVFLFVLFSELSLIFSPIGIDGSSLFIAVQIGYWFILTNVFANICSVSESKCYIKSVLLVLIITGAVFFIIPGEHGPLSQNESSFIAVSLWPFGLLLFNKWRKVLYILFSLILLYFIGSRTGLIVLLLQIFVFYSLTKFSSKTIIRLLLIIAILFALISNVNIRVYMAEKFFPEENDMQMLIENPNIAFQMDKSWVQRRIQQEKCKQVFEKYPIIGIGPQNVEKYVININTSKMNDVDDGILSIEYRNSTNRSAHNAYYQMLAENGFIGIILAFIIFVGIIRRLYKGIRESNMNIILLVSAIGLFVNLYMVSAFWGTNTWMLLGLFIGYGRYCKKQQ